MILTLEKPLLYKTVPEHLRHVQRKLVHPSGMSVELLDWMGNDIDVVNAARVSFGKESYYDSWVHSPLHPGIITVKDWQNCKEHIHPPIFPWMIIPLLNVKDEGLINYLMRERHGTPFEMVQFKFRVRAPICVVWEWVRHRIASYNVMSTRYVDWDKDYYTPEAAEWRKQVGKAGHYEFVPLGDHSEMELTYVKAMEQAFEYYGLLLEQGLAREVARNVLPMGAMTEFIWSVNLRSMFNFLSLREAENALQEIQLCATMVRELATLVVPVAMQKWEEHGRRNP